MDEKQENFLELKFSGTVYKINFHHCDPSVTPILMIYGTFADLMIKR